MNKIKNPYITINFKNPVIRIYKETLHLLGDPKYVLLSINPKESMLVISPSFSFDVKAHNIAKYLTNNSKSIVLYSTPFVNTLKTNYEYFEGEFTYKIKGEYIKEETIVKFDLVKAVNISSLE